MTNIHWRKSTRCSANNGCVAILPSARYVLVRDDKDPDGSPVLVFDRTAFADFVRFLKVVS